MSNCIQVIDADGKPSAIFAQLLGKHKGNEEKALDEFALNSLIASQTSFSLGSVMSNGKAFLNALFRVEDEFTSDNEKNMRKQLDVKLEPKKDAITGLMVIQYFTALGTLKTAPASDKDRIIDELVAEKKSLKNEMADKLLKVFNSHSSGKMEEESKKLLGENSYGLVKSSLHGLTPKDVQPYSAFAAEPWYIAGLENEKILVHVKMNSKGEKVYNLIFPSHTNGNKQFSDSGSSFIGAKILGNNALSEKHGITIAENLRGRKQLTASLLAASIKASDSKASVESARFISFSGEGVMQHLDLHHGVQVLKAVLDLKDFGSSLPAEISRLKSTPEVFGTASLNMDYVSFLFDEYNSVYDSGKDRQDFKESYGKMDKKKMLDAVNRQMYFLMRSFNRTIAGRKEYEHPDTVAGKEMLMLARAKQQLMMKEGFDYRGKNTFNEMGLLESWVSTQGEYANVDLNLVMQEINAIDEGVKQRFKNQHVKKMQASVNEFIKKNGGIGAKGRLLNDTQAYFESLFEAVKVRQLDEKGQYSAEAVEVNIMKFKDPENLANDLTTAERTFIREMVELHKNSMVRMMDKKIKDGLIKDFASGQDWYDKKYKSQELLMPVTRKSSSEILTNGNFMESASAWMEDFTNVYNLNDQNGSNKEYIFGKYGSATMQLGGEYGSENRLKSLGLEYVNDELVLVNPKKNKSASSNVEQSLNLSAYNNEKAAMEMELHTVYNTAKINLLNDRMADRTVETETLKAMFENLVYGDMEKTKFTKNRDAMKTVNAVRKITSTGTLTLNWKSALLSTMGANFALLSDAMSQRYGDYFFNVKDYGKATAWIGTNPKKFDKLIDLFMFHESDEVNLLFSDKYQAAQKGLYKSRYNMIMHAGGDRLLRGIILVSQLTHDGLIDNFTETQNGDLVYDWSKDTRNPKIKDAIQENLAYRGVENLPYDEIMMRSLTTISGKIMGSYTDSDKARFQTHEGAKVFSQFKAYLGARATNLYSQGFENVNIRHYEVDNKGELSVQSYYQEGIYQSYKQMYLEVRRLKTLNGVYDSLRPEQQANVRKLFYDVLMFGASMVLYQLIKAGLDDDDLKKNKDAFRYAEYAMMDLVGIYNPKDYLAAIASPVSVVYMGRLLTMGWNIATLDLEKAGENVISVFGPARSFDDIYSMIK